MAYWFVPELPEDHEKLKPHELIREAWDRGVGKSHKIGQDPSSWSIDELVEAFARYTPTDKKPLSKDSISKLRSRDSSLQKHRHAFYRVFTPDNRYSAQGVRADFSGWREAFYKCFENYELLKRQSKRKHQARLSESELSRKLRYATKNNLAKISTIDQLVKDYDSGSKRSTHRLSFTDSIYVERQIEHKILKHAIEDSQASIVVVGEPGTGKSSLAWSLHNKIESTGSFVCLLDANEISAIFNIGEEQGYVVPFAVEEEVRQLINKNKLVTIILDTADNLLFSDVGTKILRNFLFAMSEIGVSLIVTCRPQELSRLDHVEFKEIRIRDYNDSELPIALEKYSKIYVDDSGFEQPSVYVEKLRQAVAQKYPIGEICRNPLALRMLFSIYAPNDVNFFEINIVTLYNEYWSHRVKSDKRNNSDTSENDNSDFSPETMLTALLMLNAGRLSILEDQLLSEFEKFDLNTSALPILTDRGILKKSESYGLMSYSFFHQTFFEHASAKGLVALDGDNGMRALAELFDQAKGNLLIGAVFERALILAKSSTRDLIECADDIMDNLLNGTETQVPVAVYVLVHTLHLEDKHLRKLERLIASHNVAAVNRFLSLSRNVSRQNRKMFHTCLIEVLKSEESKWISEALDLIPFYSEGMPNQESALLEASGVVKCLIEDRGTKYTQAFTAIVPILADNFKNEPEWAWAQLVKLYKATIVERSDNNVVLPILNAMCANEQSLSKNWISELEAESQTGLLEDVKGTEEIAKRIGEILFQFTERSSDFVKTLELLQSNPSQGLAANARYNQLFEIVRSANVSDIAEYFRISLKVDNAQVASLLGRITWARYFDHITNNLSSPERENTINAIKMVLGKYDPVAVEELKVLKLAIKNSKLNFNDLEKLVRPKTLELRNLWLEQDYFSSHLIRALIASHPGAIRALTHLNEQPNVNWKFVNMLSKNALSADGVLQKDVALELLKTLLSSIDARIIKSIFQAKIFTNVDLRCVAEPLSAFIEAEKKKEHSKRSAAYEVYKIAIIRQVLSPPQKGELQDLIDQEWFDPARATLLEILCSIDTASVEASEILIEWILSNITDYGLLSQVAGLKLINRQLAIFPNLRENYLIKLWALVDNLENDGKIYAQLVTPITALFGLNNNLAAQLTLDILHRTQNLQASQGKAVGKALRASLIKNVSLLQDSQKNQFFVMIPELSKDLGRLLLDAIRVDPPANIQKSLKSLLENPSIDKHIYNKAYDYLRVVEGVDQFGGWPDLYNLIEKNNI